MSEKTIQERLRELRDLLLPLAHLLPPGTGKVLREAADLIDRLTASPSEDMVERMLDAYWTKVGVYKPGELTADNRKWPDRDIQAMKAAIAAMPSAEAIRRDEREAVFQCPNKDRGLEQCKALHTKTTTGHPLTWCQLSSCPLMPRAQNTIRARNGDRNAHD